MKILQSNAGVLTNCEVLELLRSRGAGKDPTRAIAAVAPSEFKVYDYLEQTVASKQTIEIIHKFVEDCKKYDLTNGEMLNIVNIRPSSAVEIDPIIQDCDSRMGDRIDEFLESVVQVLPPHPSQLEFDEDNGEDKEAPGDQQMEDEPQNKLTC
ncbi:DNA-directed RNA polymerase III subunit rpc9-like [Olea europaea var. sylvestris]|nr:DNA-directed RNA polymerase III subunit rpc9-like [Olea europaea var. sylvestris]XP_022872495.1 DNA-directed RNA polymerase III subunit rpc9-like [Olea europaea var. sylvestris]XP_022872496.1 DNA-directed RNA polymerase III subunit rpc9-like [Olea europaea var. sylvestris]